MSEPLTSESEIRPGRLMFAGTHVPVRNLFNYLDSGKTLDDFLRAFPTVSRELAIGVLQENARLLTALRDAIGEGDAHNIAKDGVFQRIWKRLTLRKIIRVKQR